MAHRPKTEHLKPFLVSHLNDKTIPGLEWIDEEQKIFKISWKHHGKKDWGDEDGALFKVN